MTGDLDWDKLNPNLIGLYVKGLLEGGYRLIYFRNLGLTKMNVNIIEGLPGMFPSLEAL